jgi:hypothetical protein
MVQRSLITLPVRSEYHRLQQTVTEPLSIKSDIKSDIKFCKKALPRRQ